MNDSLHKENKEKENPVKNYAHLLDRVIDDTMAMTTGAKTAAGDEVPEVTLMPDLAGLHDTLEAATSLVADWYADDAGVAA